MKRNKNLRVTTYGVWGFILSLFGMMFLPVDILALIFCGIGFTDCIMGRRRGIGWPIAGLFIGIVYFINFIASWESFASVPGFWPLNLLTFFLLLLIYYLIRREKAKNHDAVLKPKPADGTAVSSAGNTAAPSGANTASAGVKTGHPGVGNSGSVSAGNTAKARPDAETVRKQVEERTNALKEKLLEEEAARFREEEQRERRNKKDAALRKEFREKILADAAAEPPAEPDLLTQEGQRLLYTYASDVFPTKPVSEAGKTLMTDHIEDAETMIETVSGVMGALSEKILESGDGELREHWDKLARKNLVQGIKVFSFYKEMSVGSEPFELILDQLIDYLYEKETQQNAGH